MFDKEYRPPNPGLQQKGTPITYTDMNQITGELGNIVTGLGGVLDVTKDDQVFTSLTGHFAPLNSPTLTGIPLTSNPDGTINNQIATVDYVNQKALQATVGFIPVQQSGGTDQGANKIYVGADKTDATQVRIQIDQSDIGKVVFQEENNDTYGIKQIGYNHTSDFISTLDSNNNYHNIHTADYIDSKQWISSLPDSNNLKVSDIIWNSSSSLPALYYGSDNSVAYLATQDWVSSSYITGNSGEPATSLNAGVIDNNTQSPSFRDGSGNWHVLQPYGDYATNTALSEGLATKQPTLGFVPVQQGGGANQGTNKVFLGWATDGSGLRAQVDTTDLGSVVFTHNQIDYGPINGGYFTRVGNVLTQSFTVNANDGTTVNLPITMANTNYIISLITTGGGVNVNTTEVVRYLSGSKTQSGFVFLKNFVSGNSVSGETKVIPVDIIVIGVV